MTATSKEWDDYMLQSQLNGTMYSAEFPHGVDQQQWTTGWEGFKVENRRLPRFDEVERPSHYNSGTIEAIEAIKASMSHDEYLGYLKGNAVKYLWRYRYKGKPLQDLQKAQWYLNKLKEEHQ